MMTTVLRWDPRRVVFVGLRQLTQFINDGPTDPAAYGSASATPA
jgi:hypothetical protein